MVLNVSNDTSEVAPTDHPHNVIAIAPLAGPNDFLSDFAQALGTDRPVVDYDKNFDALRRAKLVIFHWPNEFFARIGRRDAIVHLAHILRAKMRGTRFIWVAHNLRPHDSLAPTPLLTTLFLRAIDGIIYLSDHSRDLVQAAYPAARSKRSLVTVHGRYAANLPTTDFERPAADAPVRLCAFGQVRPYKNWDSLIGTALTTRRGSIGLHVIGQCNDPAYGEALTSMAKSAGHIALDFSDDFLPIEALEAAIDAAHAAVLPYRQILNSGSALQALSRNRPVLVPKIGSMPELQNQVGGEWVYLYEGDLTADVLERFATAVRDDVRAPRPDLSAFEWERIGVQLRAFAAELTN